MNDTAEIEKGLPDGVKWTGDFHPAGADDYELVRERNTQTGDISARIYKGERPGAAAGIKVVPADGYVFVQSGFEDVFDIIQYKHVKGRPMFQVAKAIPPKTVTVTAKFAVDNEYTSARLEEALASVPGMPGYLSMERGEA